MKTYEKYFPLLILLATGFIIFSFIAPSLFDSEQNIEYMVPFIAIAATILTFLAFLIQHQANVQLSNDNKKQQLERQFYEMLRNHQEKIEKMSILKRDPNNGGCFEVRGCEIFKVLNEEFSFIYRITKDYKRDIPPFEYAYNIFFFGKEKLPEKDKMKIEELGNQQLIVPPFAFATGHVHLFDPYYRRLYCLVRFIANSNFFSEDEKKDYLKIVRAQMTADEQALLLYNWHYGLGKSWEDAKINQHFLSTYQMIHNIFSSSTIFSEDEIFAMFPNVPNKVKEDMFEHFKPPKDSQVRN